MVLVVDAGTTELRCVLFDQAGRVAGSVGAPWPYRADSVGPGGPQELDLDRAWDLLPGLVARCAAEAGTSARDISAVAVTGQRQALVFLDSDGRCLYAGTNADTRAVFEGGAIDEEFADRVLSTTGHAPSMLLAPAKMRFLRNQRPDAYAKIATVFALADWLAWKLTGVAANEMTLAGEAGLLDIAKRGWCAGLLEDLDVPFAASGTLVEPGTVVGDVLDAASGATGIPAGAPVVAAGADTQCGLVGMGVVDPSQVGVVAGWSAPVQMVTSEPELPSSPVAWAGLSTLRDRWVLECSAGDAGNSYRWLADTAFGGGDEAYAEMDRLASEVPAGSDGTVALLGPGRMDMSAVGLTHGGFLFPVPVAFGGAGKGQLARSALECVAYAIRANLDQVQEVSRDGSPAADVTIGGGMVRTGSFAQIQASVLGRPILVSPASNVTAAGAFMCATAALDRGTDVEDLSRAARSSLVAVEPDPVLASEYDGFYESWLQAADHVAGLPF